jgi:hypothetical protein
MIPFHRFLIFTAICFCLGFAAWTIAAWRGGAGVGALALGVAFACAGAALGYYLRHLQRFLHLRR